MKKYRHEIDFFVKITNKMLLHAPGFIPQAKTMEYWKLANLEMTGRTALSQILLKREL